MPPQPRTEVASIGPEILRVLAILGAAAFFYVVAAGL